MNTLPKDNRQVVRLTTSYWHDNRGAHVRRSLVTLKRQSAGYQLLDDECGMSGADEAIRSITNLATSKDGIYEVLPCNESRDWESGHIDGYDLELIPYTP